MPTIQQVWQQINALPDRFIFYTKKEIRYLPKIMVADERVLALTSGFFRNHTWLCVCTNRRILFLDRGMFWGLRQLQMNLDRVQSIDSSYSLFFGKIRIWDGASAIEVGLIPKPCIAPFVRIVQDSMDRYKRMMVHDIVGQAGHVRPVTAQAAPAAPSANDAWLSELERLAQLKTAGHLTDDEYAAAKAKLMGNH